MRLRAALVTLITAVAALVGTAPTASAQSVSSQMIVSGPGNGSGTNYYTPVAVAQPGAELTFVNGDLALHDVVSLEKGPDDQPWCVGFDEHQCPLFWTPLIPGLGRTTPVLGLENIESGQLYPFVCSIHSWMEGILIAV